MTRGQGNELQRIKCVSAATALMAGAVMLEFRGAYSTTLTRLSTSAQVRSYHWNEYREL